MHDVGQDAVDKRMLLVDVGGKQPAVVMVVARAVAHAQQTIVGGAVVDTQVFHINLFVVDIAGEREVGDTLLARAV